MGNRVWFLNKYCRKPFSTRTRSPRCFHLVASISSCIIPEPIPHPNSNTTVCPSSITNRTTVNPNGYIYMYCIYLPRTRFGVAPSEGRVYTSCIVCTQCCCVCILFAKLWRLRLWIFIRVCSNRLPIIYTILFNKTCVDPCFSYPFFCFLFFRLCAPCLLLWYFIYTVSFSRVTNARDAYNVYIIYNIINTRPPTLLPLPSADPRHSKHKLFVVIQYNKIQNVK